MKTILIADDDGDIRDLIDKAIEPLGHTTVKAETGEEALAQAVRYHPDLMILDVLMPGGHGFGVCKEVRARPELKRTKILILTSKAYDADRHHAMEAGADAFINKPFLVDELVNTVAILLSNDEGGGPFVTAIEGSSPRKRQRRSNV